MATVYDVSIRLGDLVSALENTKVAKSEINRRVELVFQALEMFDMVSGQDLSIITNEELRSIVSNPEDVPSDE